VTILSGGFNQTRSATLNIGGIPPSANVLKRKYRNPHAYAKLRDEWQRSIYYSASPHTRSWLEAMAKLGKKMRVKITLQHKKEYDKDNAYGGCKPLIDALVRLKWLADDDNDHLDETVDQEQINTLMTRIYIEEAR
jgi:hypothetical protein